MSLKPTFDMFDFNEVADVKAIPGLYAWYLKIHIGKPNTNSAENTAKTLIKYSKMVRYPELEMQIYGHLNLQMKGNLKHLWYGQEANTFSDSLQDVLNQAESRALLNTVFEKAVPLLTSPLYIGVSKNLQMRLHRHTQLIRTYMQERNSQPFDTTNSIISEEEVRNDENFARRVTERNINPNNLMVGVTYISSSRSSSDVIRKTIEAAETLLNRMFYPIFGRR